MIQRQVLIGFVVLNIDDPKVIRQLLLKDAGRVAYCSVSVVMISGLVENRNSGNNG
jgi:hypothetical protein